MGREYVGIDFHRRRSVMPFGRAGLDVATVIWCRRSGARFGAARG
jgi:hypothetical protein